MRKSLKELAASMSDWDSIELHKENLLIATRDSLRLVLIALPTDYDGGNRAVFAHFSESMTDKQATLDLSNFTLPSDLTPEVLEAALLGRWQAT